MDVAARVLIIHGEMGIIAGMVNDLELVFRPEVQAIFDHFCSLHGIRIAFYSSEGVELRVGQSWSDCAYCRLLKRQPECRRACATLDQAKRQEALSAGSGAVMYECHGGMTEAIMPVRVGGRLLGFAMIGQFRARRRLPVRLPGRRMEPAARRRLNVAFKKTPLFESDKARDVLALFELLVQFISDHHMIDADDALAPILQVLREHPEERLSLSRAAAMVGRSPTTLSHLFRRKLGKSFRTVRIELAMDAADALFSKKPGIRVNEVAYRLGFDDPFYFSRLYRRYRGVPPSCGKTRQGGS